MTNTEFVKYSGSHGTTQTRFLEITNNGFNVGAGYRGTGVYFWENTGYARELAIGWYVNAKRNGVYKKDEDSRCSIVWATLTAIKNEVIDYTDPKWREQLLKLFKKLDQPDSSEKACDLYDLLTTRIEKTLNTTIKIIITMVHPPKSSCYPTQTYGMAYCYVVTDTGCINVESYETLNDFDVHDKEACRKVLKQRKDKNIYY